MTRVLMGARTQARFDCRVLPGEDPESLVLIFSESACAGLSDWPEQPGVKVG